MLYAGDRVWWHEYGDAIDFDGELWTTNRESAQVYSGLHYVRGEIGAGISRFPGMIMLGRNSGYQAIGLALYFGAAKIILLGYDMQFTNGRSHWHGDHKNISNPLKQKMPGWIAEFNLLGSQTTVPIINCSRETALKCFVRKSLHEGLA